MFKNTFITLTVSLLILGLLSVIRPQTQEIESTNNQTYAVETTEQVKVDPNEYELVVKEFFVEKQEVEIEEVEEVEEEAKIETKVEQPKQVVKVEVKQEPVKVVQPVAKVEQPKTVVKQEPVVAVKAEVQEETKEEVKSEPVEQAPVQEVKEEEPAPAPVVTVSSTPAATWQLEVARLTNIERQKAGLSILKYNTSLEAGAKIRAEEIITHFSHTRPDGSRFFTAFGNLQYQNIGENLGNGFRTPESIVNAWMNSESHRANILKPEYQEISVAITKDADGKYRWVQIFYRGR